MTTDAFEVIGTSHNREDWLEKRRAGIGSSDAAAILGLSPWASPLSVYVEKTGDFRIPKEESEAMKWGNILEPIVLREYGKETGRECASDGRLLRSKTRKWQLATPDGFQRENGRGPGILEIKTTGAGWNWHEGPPPSVVAQVQHQLAVAGLAWASVAVLVNGSRLLWIDVPRDDTFIEILNAAEAEFWRRVEAGEPPAPDGSEASRGALRALYPRDSGETIPLPGEFIDLDREREALKRDQSRIGADLEAIDQRIKAAMKDATEGTLASGVRYTYRLQQRAEHVVKAAEFRVLRRHERKP